MDINHPESALNQPDRNILAELWMAFRNIDTLRSIDLQDLSVTVEDGHVFLSGHVAKDLHYQLMESIARSVTGVLAVHNHLVTDQGLVLQVCQSLARDEQLRPLVLPVYSAHGWITLGGQVPNPEFQQAAETAAAQVPTVRGVIGLPRLTGETESGHRPAIQPAIQARVYTQNGMEGLVNQVVIRPENRLVTHAVVQLNPPEDGRPAAGEILVPVEAMEVVSDEEIILKRDVAALKDFAAFSAGDYPIAPLTWQPPYPYPFGRVRWLREEMLWGEKGSRAQGADQLSAEEMDVLEKKCIQ